MDPQRVSASHLLRLAAAVTAAMLGMLMLVGGVGLGFAVVTSPQAPLQFATAAVLIAVGAVNLRASSWLLRERRRGLAASGVATASLVAYLAAIGDFGEPFLLHGIYLLLLAALACRQRLIRTAA